MLSYAAKLVAKSKPSSAPTVVASAKTGLVARSQDAPSDWDGSDLSEYEEMEFDSKMDRMVHLENPRKARAAYRTEFRANNWNLHSAEMKQYLYTYVSRNLGKKDVDYIIKLVEDVALLGYQLLDAGSHSQRISAVVTFIKLRSDGPLLSCEYLEPLQRYFDSLFGTPEVQGLDHFFEKARSALDTYTDIQETQLFKKLHRFLMYALSLSLFDKVGISFDNLRYSEMEKESIRRKHYVGASFVHCMLDTLLFISERGYQCMKTGRVDPIYHSGKSYSQWMDKAQELSRKSKFLSNPEPHGFSVPQFLQELDDAIENGKAIARYAEVSSDFEKRLVRRALADLELLKATELTRRAAGQDRKAPFSVLVFGGSSVAKSAFTKMLYYHYGKTFNLPTESEYRYVRNPNDPFWSGFTSSKWCIQLDDIAYLKPNIATQGDPTILEMLQVINSVPFVPNQAELEDKGRTPVRASLVIATSNCEDLNAFHYFHCPLAIQRRLPYVITVEPKPEYARNEVFLDPMAVPKLEGGEYPDYWLIEVKKVVPQGTDIRNQQAKLVTIEKFSDVYEFTAWFSEVAIQHATEQQKVEEADQCMAKVELCHKCYRPILASGKGCKCPDELEEQGFTAFVAWSFWSFLSWSYMWVIFVSWIQLLLCIPVVRGFVLPYVEKLIMDMSQRNMARVISALGNRFQRQIGYVRMFFYISSIVGTMYVYFKIFRKVTGIFPEKTEESDLKPQGNNQSKPVVEQSITSAEVGRAPESRSEAENVWYDDKFVATTFDAPLSSPQLSTMTEQALFEKLGQNCVLFRSTSFEESVTRFNRAICLGGQLYLINNHGLPDVGTLTIDIVAGVGEGISDGHACLVYQQEILRFPDRDFALVKLRGFAPKKNIKNMFPSETMSGVLKGFYVLRNESGSLEKIEMTAVKKEIVGLPRLGAQTVWQGKPARNTVAGECGAMLVLRNGVSPFIAGLHVAGNLESAASLVLSRELIEELCASYDTYSDYEPTYPVLNLQNSNQYVVGELHRKSPFRFLEHGVAKVYGSFGGFRSRQRSKVRKTLTCDSALKRGYEIKTGAPVMSGWEPWYNAAKDMTNPVTKFEQPILETVKADFLRDLEAGLDKDQLRKELFVYDDMTAINGCAGLRFVDKMNRATSMGFPWKRAKKHFMTEIPALPNIPNPMVFGPEVMERSSEIIAKYHRGERCMPVFTGSLKDEAIKFKKIREKKTRVFCASPVDWNIVVRKYLLAFIRVMQLNRNLFEAAVGCVAQSREWEDMRTYLTKYGTTRMIAGDYAAFDKRMPAQVMLAAYDIIAQVCEWSGNFTPEDLRVVRGIGFDTSFPLVDFNGDLVELSGSNPSGHPLTVIVNCLANSLYIRYVYAKLHPERSDAADFKDHVALMTYGDDNAMGCSATIPWFNHTSISQCLADVGIEYTMADKETESVPYISIEEVGFLKRIWRWDEDLKAFVCPLDESSIAKMLTMGVPGKTDAIEKQAIDVLSTVTREYFWYGRVVFEQKRIMCQEIMLECNLQFWQDESTFPTWDILKTRFEEASKNRLRFN